MPPVNFQDENNDYGWSVKSKLEFNVGPDTAQVLSENDSLIIYQTYVNPSTDEESGDLVKKELKPLTDPESGKLIPLAVHANYLCQYSSPEFIIDSELLPDFKLKLSEEIIPNIAPYGERQQVLTLNNYVNEDISYTKFSFDEITATTRAGLQNENPALNAALSLNVNLLEQPTVKFGLIMFYYIDEINIDESLKAHRAKITVDNGSIQLFNSDEPASDTYILKPNQIQILRLENGDEPGAEPMTKLNIYADDDYKGTIIFGALSLVKDVNPKLKYRYDSTSAENTGLDKLLKDLKDNGANDFGFYYNAPINKNMAIDLSNSESLDSPTA